MFHSLARSIQEVFPRNLEIMEKSSLLLAISEQKQRIQLTLPLFPLGHWVIVKKRLLYVIISKLRGYTHICTFPTRADSMKLKRQCCCLLHIHLCTQLQSGQYNRQAFFSARKYPIQLIFLMFLIWIDLLNVAKCLDFFRIGS